MSHNVLIFTLLFSAAILLFAWSCFRRFSLILLGKPDYRFGNPAQRLKGVLSVAFGQRCAVSPGYSFGYNHAVLFWSFLVLLVANAEFLLEGLFPEAVRLSALPTWAYFALSLAFDLVSILALLAVILAVTRRLVFPPPHIEARNPDAFVILTLVGLLMLAFFGLHGSQIAAGAERASGYMPISSLAGKAMTGLSTASAAALGNSFWWLHALILLGFLNYLPYSKHMHILTSIPNVYFRSLTTVTTQSREEFKIGNSFGVARVDQFPWKGLFDSYSCTKCGRCSDQCPATTTGKVLDPRLVIRDIKENLLENGPLVKAKKQPELNLIGGERPGSVSEKALWDCTTCGACMEVCPVFIEHVPRIVDMRRSLVEMQAKFPGELLALFENIEQRYNPWGIAPAERTKWAANTEVMPFTEGQTEYLLYVGCTGAFDSRNRKVTQAIDKVFKAGGVSWGTLGIEEMCCGDSLRRLGNEYAFEQIARKNVAMFKGKGVKKVITQCPHCYNTLKNDYRQYGLELEVFHQTEIVANLLKEGKLKLKNPQNQRRTIYHDPCYLGRYNSVYAAPRLAIAAATGKPPLEMERNHNRSFCCGAGGGRMWMEESAGEHINVNRVREAIKKEAEVICVSCPYCLTMLEDGLKDLKAEGSVQVADVAEIVSWNL